MKRYIVLIACSMSLLMSIGCQSGGGTQTTQTTEDVTRQESTPQTTVTIELATSEASTLESAITETTTTQAKKPVIDYDIAAELEQVEEQEDILVNQLQTQSSLSQGDMNMLSMEIYTLWDDELNLIWGRLQDVLSKEEMEKLTEEELEWIAYKESEADAIVEYWDGGSITPLMVNDRMAALTRVRVYELAGYLGEKIGQEVPELAREDFTGTYVDRQGTDTVHSELKIVPADDGTYAVTIGLYRLTTFEGVGVPDGDKLLYEDDMIKGEITIQGEEAMLYVTESDFEYIGRGDRFVFPEME